MAGKVVYVELIAQVKRFNSGMKKAEKSLGKVKAAAAVAGAAIAAIGAVAVRSLIRDFQDLTDELDNLQKTSDKLQFPVEAVQDLSFILEESGAKASSLTKAGLQMNYAMSQAKLGLSTYTNALDAVGLKYEDLEDKTPIEKFLILRQAMSEADDTGRALAAQTFFGGRAYKDMAIFLGMTNEEMDAAITKSQKLGNAQREQADLAANLNDRQTELNKAWKKLKIDVWEKFARILLPLKERAVEFFETMSSETRQKLIVGILVAIGVAVAAIVAGLTALAVAFSGVLVVGLKVFAFLVALGGIIYNIGLGVYTVITNLDDLGRSFSWVADKAKEFFGGLGGKIMTKLGFGADDSMAQSAASSPAVAGAGAQGTSYGPQTNNYYVSGNHQLEKQLNAREGAQRRGKGR